jgi:hypothetical protein
MSITRKVKDPNSTLDFVVDWSAWLETDTISAVSWTVPTGITQTTSSFADTTATIWLMGGTAKAIYLIGCRITTAAGRIEDHSFEILIAEK